MIRTSTGWPDIAHSLPGEGLARAAGASRGRMASGRVFARTDRQAVELPPPQGRYFSPSPTSQYRQLVGEAGRPAEHQGAVDHVPSQPRRIASSASSGVTACLQSITRADSNRIRELWTLGEEWYDRLDDALSRRDEEDE